MFIEAIKRGLQNYVNFSGRAPRWEYWYFVLFSVIVIVVATLVDVVLGTGNESYGLLQLIASLALFLPSLALFVRRLHDRDLSGWWVLIVFIPLVGFVMWLYWACTKGTTGANRFGPDPVP